MHTYCKNTLILKENINDCHLEVTLLKLMCDNFDKLVKQLSKNLRRVEYFRYENLVKGNGIKFMPSEIVEAFDNLIVFNENADLSREIFLAYIFEVLLNGGKIEYNDIVDINILSLAIANDSCFITEDDKVFRVMKFYENKMNIGNVYTKKIIVCKNIQELKTSPLIDSCKLK